MTVTRVYGKPLSGKKHTPGTRSQRVPFYPCHRSRLWPHNAVHDQPSWAILVIKCTIRHVRGGGYGCVQLWALCIIIVTWRCRENSSQWECRFLWNLRCHWLIFLRQRQRQTQTQTFYWTTNGSRFYQHQSRITHKTMYIGKQNIYMIYKAW